MLKLTVTTMSPRTYTLDNLDIGGGLHATAVQVTDGPIVLVDVRMSQRSPTQRSRLDLHKSMFIDPLPGQRDAAAVQELAQVVLRQLSDLPGREPPHRH